MMNAPSDERLALLSSSDEFHPFREGIPMLNDINDVVEALVQTVT